MKLPSGARSRARLGALGAALFALGACGDSDGPPGARLVAEDSRYRVTLARAGSSGPDTAELHLRVEPTNGWHIAPEAPARLRFAEQPGLHWDPAELSSEETGHIDADGLEFGTTLRMEAGGPTDARAHLKFGICEGPKEKCVIVRRDLELPLSGS